MVFPIVMIGICVLLGGGVFLYVKFPKKQASAREADPAVKSANEFVNVRDVRGKFLYTQEGLVLAYLRIMPFSMDLYSGNEKKQIARQLTANLSAVQYPFQRDPMDETMRLIQMAHEGDKAARDQLVEDNVGLVWSIVRRFAGRGHELEDLFQIGSIGLLKAIDKFDLSYDVRFSTYAVPMITGEIKRFLRDDGLIKVSRSVKELGMKVGAARESLSGSLGREPTIEEIAGELKVSREEVAASLEAGAEVESLYRPFGKNDGQELCLMDRLEEKEDAEETLLNRMVLRELISELGPKEREIIIRRYFYNQTQSVIAADLDISQVQVSRLEKKILRQMREKL